MLTPISNVWKVYGKMNRRGKHQQGRVGVGEGDREPRREGEARPGKADES